MPRNGTISVERQPGKSGAGSAYTLRNTRTGEVTKVRSTSTSARIIGRAARANSRLLERLAKL